VNQRYQAGLLKQKNLALQRLEEAKMTPTEKRAQKRRALIHAIEEVEHQCPAKVALTGYSSVSYFVTASQTPEEVRLLYSNLNGHYFMPMESEFDRVDINYLISKVVTESTRHFILAHSKLPAKPGLFSQGQGPEVRGGNPASLEICGINISREDLYRASQLAEKKRKEAQAALIAFDAK